MTKIPYLHHGKDKTELIKKYYIALFLLLLFGIYKNGILLYQHDFIPFYQIFLPLYFYGISMVVGLLLSLIWQERPIENIFIALLVSCSISINTNFILYPVLLFIGLFIGKFLLKKSKMRFHTVSFARLILILGLLLNAYSYLNIAEKLNKFNYNLFDLFIGYGVGGIATTSILLLIVSFIILCTSQFYKKIIPITSTLSFVLLNLISFIFTKDAQILTILLNGNIYFGFLFVSTDFLSTPSDKKGMMIYGMLIGLFSFLFQLAGLIYEASYLAIFLLSFFTPFIDKISNQKYYKNS